MPSRSRPVGSPVGVGASRLPRSYRRRTFGERSARGGAGRSAVLGANGGPDADGDVPVRNATVGGNVLNPSVSSVRPLLQLSPARRQVGRLRNLTQMRATTAGMSAEIARAAGTRSFSSSWLKEQELPSRFQSPCPRIRTFSARTALASF